MLSGAKACKSCRSRQELSNEYLLAKLGVDTAENEPLKVCQKLEKQLRIKIGCGGSLVSKRGINVPGVSLDLPAVSPQDEEALALAAEGAD